MTVRLEAVSVVARRAAMGRADALSRLASALGSNVTEATCDTWAEAFRVVGRLTINFHPDRKTALGMTVAEGLYDHGWYYSQFKTGVSNGSRSAVPGGERDEWEHRLFDGAYRSVGVEDAHRPVYGSLDLARDLHGGSPRFGSSFLVLKSHVRERATLCVGDSHAGPRDVGTNDEPLSILAGLFEQAVEGKLLGRRLGMDDLLALLDGRVGEGCAARVLDGYVEAQVHGGVNLAEDVESVVLDPSFRGTAPADHLTRASMRYGFSIEWHTGSELEPADIPPGFRLPETPALARRVARLDGLVDAAAIGRAAHLVELGTPTPAGDPPESDLQQLKYLWHAVLALGRDALPSIAPLESGS